jgi:hypothetical protein
MVMIRWFILISVLAILSACNPDNSVDLPTRVVLDTSSSTLTAAPFGDANFINVLNFWEATTGVLAADEADAWRFLGQAGDAIAVRVLGIDAILTLETENEEILQRGDTIQIMLPANGIYTVIVQSAVPGEGGDYEIGLGYTDRVNPAETFATPLPHVVGVPTPEPSFVELGTYISRLTSGDSIGGLMSPGEPDHIYTFDGVMGEYIELEASYVSGEINPRLTLYNPDGLPMATDDDSGENHTARLRNIYVSSDGVYTVQVSGGGLPGGYAIRFQRSGVFIPPTITPIPLVVPTPTTTFMMPTPALITAPGNRLEADTPMMGFLDSTNTSATHPIYVAAGEIISVGVQVAAEPNRQLQLQLRSPTGEVVAQADTDSADAVIAAYQALVEGAYQVAITFAGEGAGQYIITYRRGVTWSDDLRGPVARDEIHEGEIAQYGVADVWTVELRAGDIITAAVSPILSLTFDPILEIAPVHDPHAPIVFDDNGGGGFSAYVPRVEIPETGLYLMRVYAARGETIGAYTLIWRYINIAPTATPALRVAPILTLDDVVPNQSYQFYPFQGHSGQRVRISVIATEEGFDPVVALIGPGGEVLVEADDIDGDLNPVIVFMLPADDTYNVRVNGYLQGGAFRLLVEDVLN